MKANKTIKQDPSAISPDRPAPAALRVLFRLKIVMAFPRACAAIFPAISGFFYETYSDRRKQSRKTSSRSTDFTLKHG
ncbi:hypothetical protein [Thiosocius teredinicola]|uniref:hypothetical protein n=1 Tax=Thiosocius teredinicola TaxID=1973002 RepID=UPI0013DE6C5A